MKKDRNAFFQESQYFNQTAMPMPMVANQPFTTNATASQSFYAGPSPMMNQVPVNYTTQPTPGTTNNFITNDYNDLESRLSKIERQLNRMDARLNKLESGNFYTTEDIDNSTNMYMV